MRITILDELVVSFILLLLLASTNSIAASPTLEQSKKEAEAKGHILFTTHDEIVAMAKKEGKLRVMTALNTPNYKPLVNAFKQKFPFISDIHVEDIRGTDAHQRVILEIKSGQAKGWDIAHIAIDFAQVYMPYLMKHDILGMAKHGVLKIHPLMIHPVQRNIVSPTSAIRVVAYNRKLIPEDKVPVKWEDFLKPEFKGRKFVVDVRPLGVAPLVPAWGLERTLDFARKLAAQQPVWGGGTRRVTAALLVGEYSLYLGSSFNSIKIAMGKDPTGSLSYRIIEPVPTRTVEQASGILVTADHPHAALLWLEFLASPEGQEIIDKYEPFEASVFTPGSVMEELTRDKKLSVVDWDHFTRFQEYQEKISAAYGFPSAGK